MRFRVVGIPQVADGGELPSAGLALDPRGAAAASLRVFGRKRHRGDEEGALFQGLERSCKGVAAHRVEDDIHVFDGFVEELPGVVGEFIRSQVPDQPW